MLIDELKEQLKSLAPALSIIKQYWAKSDLEKQFQTLEQKTNQEDF